MFSPAVKLYLQSVKPNRSNKNVKSRLSFLCDSPTAKTEVQPNKACTKNEQTLVLIRGAIL